MSQTFEFIDARFRFCVLPNAEVKKLYSGTLWGEGPVYFADGDYLLWSDIPNNRVMRWIPNGSVEIFLHPSNFANGHTRDRQGRLVSCEHGGRRVTRTEPDGRTTVLADAYQGKRLNSPNDVVVKSDDTIWFTDPLYGILADYEGCKAESELAGECYVFRINPHSGAIDVMADNFIRPNGLAFSPDERILYISDTERTHNPDGRHHIRAFDLDNQGGLYHERIFAEVDPGVPDGFRVDTDGNVWTSAADGVHCYSPQGELLGKIRIPETVSNLTFGGPRKNRLFITASNSLYAVYVACNGVQTP